jgi:hypothetical protein
MRLHQGERQKAARGDLRLPLPAGLTHSREGGVILTPDEEVQERLRLVFTKFRELRSAKAVMRYLRRAGLVLPVRPIQGPAPHEIIWRPADSAKVIHILKNPAYAGAYVYGRRRQNPIRQQPGNRRIATVTVALEDWSVCLRDAHPAYIDWEEFMANQRQLADNLNRYEAGRPGVPRKGSALLQGIVSCGRCGRACACATLARKAIIRSTCALLIIVQMAGHVVRKFVRFASMPRLNAYSWWHYDLIRLRWQLQPWGRLSKNHWF